MTEVIISTEDAEAINGILLSYRAEGVTNPLLPMDVDVDGDGIVDSFGLDENDEVVVIRGKTLEETVYISEGDDIGPEIGGSFEAGLATRDEGPS